MEKEGQKLGCERSSPQPDAPAMDGSHLSEGRFLRICPPVPHASPLSFLTLVPTPILGTKKMEVKGDEQSPLGPDLYASDVAFVSNKMTLFCHVDEHGNGRWL